MKDFNDRILETWLPLKFRKNRLLRFERPVSFESLLWDKSSDSKFLIFDNGAMSEIIF